MLSSVGSGCWFWRPNFCFLLSLSCLSYVRVYAIKWQIKLYVLTSDLWRIWRTQCDQVVHSFWLIPAAKIKHSTKFFKVVFARFLTFFWGCFSFNFSVCHRFSRIDSDPFGKRSVYSYILKIIAIKCTWGGGAIWAQLVSTNGCSCRWKPSLSKIYYRILTTFLGTSLSGGWDFFNCQGFLQLMSRQVDSSNG